MKNLINKFVKLLKANKVEANKIDLEPHTKVIKVKPLVKDKNTNIWRKKGTNLTPAKRTHKAHLLRKKRIRMQKHSRKMNRAA